MRRTIARNLAGRVIGLEFHYAIPYMLMIYNGIAFHFPVSRGYGVNMDIGVRAKVRDWKALAVRLNMLNYFTARSS